jgi:hypothetical protein
MVWRLEEDGSPACCVWRVAMALMASPLSARIARAVHFASPPRRASTHRPTAPPSLTLAGALDQFNKGMLGDQDPSEALAAAEASFVREATASVPAKTGWGVKAERASLVGIMQAIIAPAKKATQIKLQSAQQLNTAMQYLQMQQQQMQAMQAQYTGGQGGKWNVGAAYRPPDTNINLSGSFQQGRTNIQVSMVPDEGAALLGQNGFSNGVGPANLGLSFNIHL